MQKNLLQDDMINELTQKLPLLRETYDINQTRLGVLVGKSRQQISKIERGITPLAWDTCLAIVMVTHNKNPILFDEVMGKDYYTQLHDFINKPENKTA